MRERRTTSGQRCIQPRIAGLPRDGRAEDRRLDGQRIAARAIADAKPALVAVVPTKGGGLRLLEAKAGSSVRPDAAASMLRLRDAIAKSDRRGSVEMAVVYESVKPGTQSVSDGVRAVGWRELSQI